MTWFDWGAQYLRPTWQLSASVTVILLIAAMVLWRRYPRAVASRSFAREFAVVIALHGLWLYVGQRVRTHSAGAMHRAQQVQHVQARLHLPSELSLQHAFLAHPLLIKAMNVYYASAHLNGMLFFLIWVWWRHRPSFRTVRNTVVATTLICLVLQMIPVAPPRLLPGAGFVDTGLQFGQSVYGTYTDGLASQLTAMPSVHVAWAFILAWYIGLLARGPGRGLGAAHLVLTVLVVAVTGNHWWLDGIVAIAIVFMVMAGQAAARGWWPPGATHRGTAEPDEVPAARSTA